MKSISQTFSASAVALLFLFIVGSLGQSASAQHLISTKAGFVNRVEGKVMIQRQDSENGEMGRASLGTQMRNGDWLITTADSRAEVLLNPGSYLRMDEKAKIRAVNTDLAEIRFELVSGSIIIEVGAPNTNQGAIDKKMALEVVTPQGQVSIAKEGLYRFDAKGAVTSVSVRKGELFLGTRDQLLAKNATRIGKGKRFDLIGANSLAPQVAKLEKDVLDGFDQWSYQRAEMLVAANYSVLRRSQTLSGLAYGWIYDPFYNCYTFIPGSRFLSPYGFSFYRSFGECGCYLHYYYPYYGSGPYYNGGGVVGSGGGVSTVPRGALGSGSSGREPIHREIPTARTIDSGSYSGSRGDYGSSGASRSIDMGGGAPRGSVGGGSVDSSPRSSGGGDGGSRGAATSGRTVH